MVGCPPEAVRQIDALTKEAFDEISLKQVMAAWRLMVKANDIAKQKSCTNHKSMARVYLVLGAIEHHNQRDSRMRSAFRHALRLDRKIVFPRELPIRALHTALAEVGREVPSSTDQADRAAASEAGCQTDRDCKGERICEGGQCASPSRSMARRDGPNDPPPVRRTPRRPAPKGHFSERGALELGGGVGFGYQETRLKQDSYPDFKTSTTTFRIDAYIGYFFARRFVLGVIVSVPVSRSKTEGFLSTNRTNSWGIAMILAPGFAVPIGNRTFVYGDALLGVSSYTKESGGSGAKTSYCYFGAELGLKFVLGKNYLLRIGLRPAYLVGDVGESELTSSDLRVGMTLGFSGFL